MKTLFLRWVLPTSLAENTPHCASNPISESSPSTTDMNRLANSPVTFSIKRYLGCTWRIIRQASKKSPDRVPLLIPFCLPATEMSVQGKPKATVSTSPLKRSPLKVVTSLHIGASSRVLSSILATRIDAVKASRST